MSLAKKITVIRLATEEDRNEAMKVLKETYRVEKNWVADEEKMFSAEDLQDESVSWFLAMAKDEPVGVLRILYNPPLELYNEYGFEQVGEGIDVEKFVEEHQIAEIGRFAVRPEYRQFVTVAAALMRTAVKETVDRGFSHYITDVFEGEKHSPYEFHTRVMGFQLVATHDVGELNCPNRRLTLVLDIRQAYNHLRKNKKYVFRLFTQGWSKEMHAKLNDD